MRAAGEPLRQAFGREGNGIWLRDAAGIEAELARFRRECLFQKSRSA
jgi:hypothetical protein